MHDSLFLQTVADFLQFQADGEAAVNLRDADVDASRPGRWLVSSIGLAYSCVGLGYRDAVWARRFLDRADTRSAEEMLRWDDRSLSAWLRRNREYMAREYGIRFSAESVLGDEGKFARVSIVRGIDWDRVGMWGPGVEPNSVRVDRLKCLYVLTRLVAMEYDAHAALSFMIGSNRYLGGSSPLLTVALDGRDSFEFLLGAVAAYLEEGLWAN